MYLGHNMRPYMTYLPFKVGNTSYRDISVVVAENNSIVKPISAPYNTTILDHVTGARLSCTNK